MAVTAAVTAGAAAAGAAGTAVAAAAGGGVLSNVMPFIYGTSSLFSLGTGINNLTRSNEGQVSRIKLNEMFDNSFPLLNDLDYLSSREKDFFLFPFNNIQILIERKDNGGYNFFYKNYDKNELKMLDSDNENLIPLNGNELIINKISITIATIFFTLTFISFFPFH